MKNEEMLENPQLVDKTRYSFVRLDKKTKRLTKMMIRNKTIITKEKQMKLSKKQIDKLWGEDVPYTEVNLIIQTRGAK